MTFNDALEVHYVDGKPVVKKVDIVKDIKKELEPEKDSNPFDDLKRQLYNDLPQASIKRDRSMTARALNKVLESFNRYKNENKITEVKIKAIGMRLFRCGEWEFEWYTKTGLLVSTDKPSNGYNLEYKSPSIIATKDGALEKVYKIMEEHIKRRKG